MTGVAARSDDGTDDPVLTCIRKVLARANMVGFVTDEPDSQMALREALQSLGLKSLDEAEAEFLTADEAEAAATPGGAVGDFDDSGAGTGWPPFDGGTHSKGGLYGVENDYFGEDWEPRE